MSKRFVLLAGLSGVIFLSMVAATCGDTSTTVENTGVQNSGISVSGEGKVQGKPDIANISLGVSVLANTVADARTKAATSMTAIVDSMKSNGVTEKDIQTSQLNISPEYDYNDNRQVLRGFRVTNTVNAKLRDIDKTGKIVDDAVQGGGDDTTINGISFGIDDPEDLRTQAREAAVADARSRAETLAKAGGVELGKPITISETSYSPPTYYNERFAADSAAGASVPETPVEVGELDVIVSVSVTWEIK